MGNLAGNRPDPVLEFPVVSYAPPTPIEAVAEVVVVENVPWYKRWSDRIQAWFSDRKTEDDSADGTRFDRVKAKVAEMRQKAKTEDDKAIWPWVVGIIVLLLIIDFATDD